LIQKLSSEEGDELEVLEFLLINMKMNIFNWLTRSIETIKFRMEQMGYNQNDLANIVGLKSRASEILNRKGNLH
jgi:HTH-type transcriptional regulator/antitoxin HigA